MAQNLDLGCVFGYRIPAPLVPGVPTKTRLQSRTKKFKSHFGFAGGASVGAQNGLVRDFREAGVNDITFLDFVKHLPLFTRLHQDIVDNPLERRASETRGMRKASVCGGNGGVLSWILARILYIRFESKNR